MIKCDLKMNPVPRIQLNPWAVDDRVATQDAEALHAQHTAVKAKFFYSSLELLHILLDKRGHLRKSKSPQNNA